MSNDIALIALSSVLLYLASVIIHELAHYVKILQYGKKPVINIDNGGIRMRYDNNGITANQEMDILCTGVIAGILPLLFIGLFHWIPFIIAIILYVMQSYRDLRRMATLWDDGARPFSNLRTKDKILLLIVAFILFGYLMIMTPTNYYVTGNVGMVAENITNWSITITNITAT